MRLTDVSQVTRRYRRQFAVMKLPLFICLLLALSFLGLVPKPATELLLGSWIPLQEGSHVPDETMGKMVFTPTTCIIYYGGQPEVRLYALTNQTSQHPLKRAAKARNSYLHFFYSDGDTAASNEVVRLDTATLVLRPIEGTDTLRLRRVR
jgi:hypothetical protein